MRKSNFIQHWFPALLYPLKARLKSRIVLVAVGAFLLLSCEDEVDYNEGSAERPNILLIVLDDLGKEWVSLYGGSDVGTPHLQELANDGLVLDNFYVNPQCTPTLENLIDTEDPVARTTMRRLLSVIETMPHRDADPKYRRRAENDWDVAATVPSQSWKQ